jgi:carboxysome peptide A
MKIFCVEGTLVATARIRGLELNRLLVVVDRKGSKQVAVDPVGCKPGDWVIACGSSAAREAAGHKDYPSDLTIVGIIDYWDEEAPGQASPAEERPEEQRPEEPELLVVEPVAASPNGGPRR